MTTPHFRPIYASLDSPALYHFRHEPGRQHVGTIRVKSEGVLRGMTASEAIEDAAIEMRIEWARTRGNAR